MSSRRSELTRQAARLFAEKGYHGTSIGDLAEAMGVQKGSLYAHIDSKADLLWEVARDGAAAFHAGLDTVPEGVPANERIRLALRAHLRVVGEQLEIATVFIREWRYLEGERRDEFVAERRRDAVELGREAADADALIVFSGDGGFNEVLNGVERTDQALGFVPGGGTSVLPRALGLPRDAVTAAELLADALRNDRTRKISTGRVNGRRFGFGAGIGIDAEAVRRIWGRGRTPE